MALIPSLRCLAAVSATPQAGTTKALALPLDVADLEHAAKFFSPANLAEYWVAALNADESEDTLIWALQFCDLHANGQLTLTTFNELVARNYCRLLGVLNTPFKWIIAHLETVIIAACRSGSLEALQCVIESTGYTAEAFEAASISNRRAAVHAAAFNGHAATTRWILDWVGYTTEEARKNHGWLLGRCCSEGRTEVVQVLLEKFGYEPGDISPWAFYNMLANGHVDLAGMIVAKLGLTQEFITASAAFGNPAAQLPPHLADRFGIQVQDLIN